MKKIVFPFPAIVGQKNMKLALILNIINPRIGGVLLCGEKGTAKSTAVRALTALFTEMPVIDLPLGATEDRVLGSIDIEAAIRQGKKVFYPGLLSRANKGILYIDEINLLSDSLGESILDTLESGVNIVEREGISFSHSADFSLVGSMNPEEGKTAAGDMAIDATLRAAAPYQQERGLSSGKLLRKSLRQNPDSKPIMLLVTDGRGNVALQDGPKPLNEIFTLSDKLASEVPETKFMVIDSEAESIVRLDLAKRLAEKLNADYFKTEDLKAEDLISLVEGKRQ